MLGPVALAALALLGADPAEEIDSIDASALSAKDREALELEAHVRVPATDPARIELERGDARFVTTRVRLPKAAPVGSGVTIGRVTAGNGVMVWRWLESATVSGRDVSATYVVRSTSRARSGETPVVVQLDVRNPSGAIVTSATARHTVNVGASSATPASIGRDQAAFVLFQSRAARLRRAHPKLQEKLRLDRLVTLSRGLTLNELELADVHAFLAARVRAEIARSRLRSATQVADTAEAAAIALGRLPAAPEIERRARARAERQSVAKSLAAAQAALADIRLDEGEALSSTARMSGKATLTELATALALLGAFDVLRGRADSAAAQFGRARCLDPNISAPTSLPIVAQAFDASAATGCQTPTALGAIVALRRETKEGLAVDVSVALGPDPFGLVTGGDLELWGSGGGVIEVQQVRVVDDGEATGARGKKRLEARFADEGDLETFAGTLLVRAIAKDVSGVAIAVLGVPDPIAIRVTEAEADPDAGLPWWVWAVGGMAVAGAATAGVLIAGSGRGDPGIGGISARF